MGARLVARARALVAGTTLGSAIVAIVSAAPASPARAQVTVAVSAPASVAARVPVLVRVEVTAPAAASVRLIPPAFSPFHLVRADHAPADTAGLGGRQRLDWRFVLQPGGAGTFAFEPFEADVQGPGLRPATFRSRAWSVSVLPAPAAAGPIAAATARADAADVDPSRLGFDARVTPERVFVGQQTTLELRVGIGTRVRERLRRSPEFAFPNVAGVVAYDLSARHVSSGAADLHVYRRALFPLAAGTVEVPAAQLAYALTPEDDPFGTEARVVARSSMRSVVVVPPPAAGRPTDWNGAVGRFRASARIDSAHARVGDAVVYTLRVAGTGNVMLLPRPPLAVQWADVAPAGERVTVDSTGDLAGGEKEFDWLLTPRVAGAERVPSLAYAYFDPIAATYATADVPAIDVRVAPGTTASLAPARAPRATEDAAPRTELGVWRTPGAGGGPALVTRRGFWLALAAVPAPGALWLVLAATLARWRRRGSARTAPSLAADSTARAQAAAASAEFIAGLARLTGSPASVLADPRAVARTLRRAGIGRALARECEEALGDWHRRAYGTPEAEASAVPSAPTPRALLGRVAHELADARERAAESRGEWTVHAAGRPVRVPRHVWAALAIGVAVLAVSVAAPRLAAPRQSVASAGASAHARSAFDAGVSAYAAGDAARARDLFVAAADATPADATAWLNAGTAAWAAGDTATAAFGWQRAAHLAPGLAGVRARLERLPAVAGAGRVGAPPVVDADAAGWVALVIAAAAALWMLTSALALSRTASATAAPALATRAFARRGPLVAYLLAVLLAGGASLAARAMDVRGLAVARAPLSLRPEPVAEAPTAGAVATGEVARVVADEGGWLRVRFDGEREGWVRGALVAPLDGAP